MDNIHTKHEERVTSTYAEIYYDDEYCGFHKTSQIEPNSEEEPSEEYGEGVDDDWTSPSDQLIGIVELKPPFTSKITRGKTHEGILAIGESVLANERTRFLKKLNELLKENDQVWSHVLATERKLIEHKVKKIYDKIFEAKSKTMTREISEFYEQTLHELEEHMRSQLKDVLISVRASMISDLNIEIKEKLAKERVVLEKVLKQRYISETNKIKRYYKLLLDNELEKRNKLINQALHQRNDALLSFYRQIEAENITSTMYVMCTERKKCKIKQFILETIQTTDIVQNMEKNKQRKEVLDEYKRKEVRISQINRDWEEKIKKVVTLFLKFISFSLKLLPEQTTFLLELEKMIVLQMNEIQKHPQKYSSILTEEETLQNLFQFEAPEPEVTVCEGEPFAIVGDSKDPTPPKYGSRETLPSDVDIPFFRVDRKYVYAKCHNFEEIKEFLESRRCKCQDIPSASPSISPSPTPVEKPSAPTSLEVSATENVSIDEPLLIDDIQRLHHCPARKCQKWVEIMGLNLNAYLDFTEENFKRVSTILSQPKKTEPPIELIDPKKYVTADLPFSPTKEPFHNVETQYSSQEDVHVQEFSCTCFDTNTGIGAQRSFGAIKGSPSKELKDILEKRRTSLRNLMQKHPKLLKMFTDECFDFQL